MLHVKTMNSILRNGLWSWNPSQLGTISVLQLVRQQDKATCTTSTDDFQNKTMAIRRIMQTHFCGVIFVTSFLWHSNYFVLIMITWFSQNHKKCYQILDSDKKRIDHKRPADTNEPLSPHHKIVSGRHFTVSMFSLPYYMKLHITKVTSGK